MATIKFELTIDALTNEQVEEGEGELMGKVEAALKKDKISAEITDTLDIELDEVDE